VEAQGRRYFQAIDSYARSHNFSGTIVVKHKTLPIYSRSFGFANRQFKVPNRPDTKYKIASITKAFTAVLILRLQEQHKLSLDQTINNYLPTYSGPAGDKVTIRELLNHTSGMANIDRGLTSAEVGIKNGMPHYQTPLTTDNLVAKYCSESLVNEPGKNFDYNNADYIILGKIIERLYGDSYDRVLKREILTPIGMNNSGMLYQYEVLDNLADTYFFRADLKRLVNDLPVYIENWYAAGAMYSTTQDLLRFSDALFKHKLLRDETLALMLAPGLDSYGFGLWVYQSKINGKDRAVVKRPGRIMGAQSMLLHLLNDDLTIVMLSNTDSTNLDDFAAYVAKQVTR
jgi:CubicO group peptidase (beta-lactamase class C family)